MSDLFGVEKKIIIDAEAILAKSDAQKNPLHNDYSLLLTHYKKLFRQLTRLIKINDKQSTRLTSENLVLEQVSKYDELTGILNRRSFNECFSNEWQKGLKLKNSIALLVIDIDFFKSVNDTYGHQAGDDILVQVASGIQAAARRENDLAARYGGEEFVLLLPNVIGNDAKNIAEKLRMKIEESSYKASDKSLKVTISIGVSTLIPEESIKSEILIQQADMALYSAKNSGRNKVCLFGDVKNEGEGNVKSNI